MRFQEVLLLLLFYFGKTRKFFNNMFEGDIAMRDEMNNDDKDLAYEAFLRHSSRKWPYNHVPYYIDENSIRYKNIILIGRE